MEKSDREILYTRWLSMKRRCYNPNDRNYRFYGARGVRVCDEWKDNFESFYQWAITHGFKRELTIDRIDYYGNYEPINCRWITMKEQSNNRRDNHRYCIDGVEKTLSEWCDIYGVSYEKTAARILNYGWDVKEALTNRENATLTMVTYQNETHSIAEWANITGLPYRCIQQRITKNKWSPEKALTTPLISNGEAHSNMIEYNGETHNIKEWAQIYNINPITLSSRLRYGWSFENAISTPINATKEKLVTYNGETHNIKEWSEILDIGYPCLQYRLKHMSIDEAFTRPVAQRSQRYNV